MSERGFKIEIPADCNYEAEPAWGKGRNGCAVIKANNATRNTTRGKDFADKDDI